MVGTALVTGAAAELAYWRALAEERGRRLEELRALLLTAIDGIADEHVRAFVTALDTGRPSWLRELDGMRSTLALEPAQILSVLDDLWRQVAADPDS
jgi:hypothetical protein